MSYKLKTNNRGFTLVELIITITILGIIIVPVGTMFISNYISYYSENKKINASSEMLFALNKVFDCLRQSQQETITIGNDGQKVDFKINEEDYSIRYQKSNKNLVLTNALKEQVLLNNVSEVYITEIENGRISIKVTTVTVLPFQESYVYTRTYDYKKRTDIKTN